MRIACEAQLTTMNYISIASYMKRECQFLKHPDCDRTRTCDPQIRSLVPYPFGHTALVIQTVLLRRFIRLSISTYVVIHNSRDRTSKIVIFPRQIRRIEPVTCNHPSYWESTLPNWPKQPLPLFNREKDRPWQDLNLQSPVSETDALSIRPQGQP